MPEHNLFRGGGRADNGWMMRMYPSVEVGPNCHMESAAHKDPVHFSLTWCLAPGMQCHDSPLRASFMAQAAYFRDLDAPLAVGDEINAVILPRMTSLIDLWVMNCCPIEGLEFEIRIRGNADSLGGTTDAPVPVTLATVDMGQVTWGTIVSIPAQPAGDGAADADGGELSGTTGEYDPGDVDPTPNAGQIFFNQNDMLQLVVTALPADGLTQDMLNCMRFAVSPVIREYMRGDLLECLGCCGTPPAVPTAPVAP
ncbi:MAG: hypothetical protein ACK5MY_02490 [Jhaorihella sp.]